ncbi:hypothetical protein D1007_31221 [Hordeum vulgare]|nr:hypothetical protein D1007_31221 [Hordeum vulgare]
MAHHSISQPPPPPKKSSPIVHNETIVAEQGGFVAILANLTHRAFAMEEPPEYVVYQEHMSDAICNFWATVHIYGRTTSYEPQAIQLAAREAIVQLRHLSPRVNYRSFYYYREGYGRPLLVTTGDHETDPAMLHLVCYMRAQEALYDKVTLDLIAACGEQPHLDPSRREADPDASNPVLLFGRPIELLRSSPAAEPNHAPISPRELHRILGVFSDGIVATPTSNGHHTYPILVAQPSSLSNRDVVVPTNLMSARPAHLDVNKVD